MMVVYKINNTTYVPIYMVTQQYSRAGTEVLYGTTYYRWELGAYLWETPLGTITMYGDVFRKNNGTLHYVKRVYFQQVP